MAHGRNNVYEHGTSAADVGFPIQDLVSREMRVSSAGMYVLYQQLCTIQEIRYSPLMCMCEVDGCHYACPIQQLL